MEIAIIGAGLMGEYTAKALYNKAEKINICSSKPREMLEKMFQGDKYRFTNHPREAVITSDVDIFCVPTDVIYDKMLEALPFCKKGAIISGQTSRKKPEADAFDKYTGNHPESKLELVTIHTLCNPATSNAKKEILGIIRHNSSDSAFDRAFELYGDMSEHIEIFDNILNHDLSIANTQTDTSRNELSTTSTFAKRKSFPWLNGVYSNPIDEIKLALAVRVATLPPHVYRGIQFNCVHGKELVQRAMEIEEDLYGMIICGYKEEYKKRVLSAKKTLFGNKNIEPILTDKFLSQIKDTDIKGVLDNSHYSLIQNAVYRAETGLGLYEDIRTTTPMYTALITLIDYLFNKEGELERAIEAPFMDTPEGKKLRRDDYAFHNEITAWSLALLHNSTTLYNKKHKEMIDNLNDPAVRDRVKTYVDRSKDYVEICRQALMESGRVKLKKFDSKHYSYMLA